MNKVTLLVVTLLLTAGLAVFAGGKQEAVEETEASAVEVQERTASGAVEGLGHTVQYELDEWEAESGTRLEFAESPMLADRVAQGELPAVEDRLPADPLVIQPSESVGRYGGTWRRANLGVLSLQIYTDGDEDLYTRDYYCTEVWHNILKDSSLSDDATTLTLYMREGMKWSDGAPFTADDFMFWFEDITLNEEYTPNKPSWLIRDGEFAEMSKIDDYTVRLSFAAPYGTIVGQFANAYPPQPYLPAHYLKQFHPDYASESELAQRLDASGFKTWPELLGARNDTNGGNPERPILGAFVPLDEKGAPVVRFERNPYYFKVDVTGQQLPYFDRVEETLMSDAQAIVLRALAGDIDVQGLRLGGTTNLPVLSEGAEKGEYNIVTYSGEDSNLSTITLNYFHEDEVLRELFLDKRFRVALSHGIDRQEISDLSYKGIAVPSQPSAATNLPYYVEEYAMRYLEYDPDRSNELLDEIGLEWDSSGEYRLRPDGKRLRVEIKAFTPWPAENVENSELIKNHWKELGIEAVVKPTDRRLWEELIRSAQFDVATYATGYGGYAFPPYRQTNVYPGPYTHWATMWGAWLESDGREGVEPPAAVKRLDEIVDSIPATRTEEERLALYKETMKIHSDNLFQIGVVREPNVGRFFVMKKNVGNQTEYGNASWRIASYKFPYAWATYYFKD